MDTTARNRNNRSRGARVEREVAELVGGKRVANMGGRFFDVQSTSAGYEVKSRRQATPALIAGAWEQALRAAAATGLEPNVVLAYTPGRGKPREFWLVRRLDAPPSQEHEHRFVPMANEVVEDNGYKVCPECGRLQAPPSQEHPE